MYKKVFHIALLSLLASLEVKADVTSVVTSIEQIYSYAVAGDGDMLIVPKDTLPECDGFWLDNNAPGFQGNLSVALSAYHAGSPVQLYGKENELFSGSSSKFCKLMVLRLLKK